MSNCDYALSPGEYDYCHKCGFYLIPEGDLLCAKCLESNTRKAKLTHEIMEECKQEIYKVRSKYLTKEKCTAIRKKLRGIND